MPFSAIAASITERVDDPSAAGVDRYVGLEHLDPESTQIRRWGSPDDVASTKLRFYPGDVVYGRRRAYQRKLGVADFEGICSAHALVLRAKTEVCLAAFLPYFLQSDAFHERAVGISVGSLSPTINWRTLAKEEFALPPLDEQQRIVEVMRHVDATRDRHLAVLDRVPVLRSALFAAAIEGDSERKALSWGRCRSDVEVTRLGQLCEVSRGASPRPKGNPEYFASSRTAHHWIMIGDLSRSRVGKVLTDTQQFLTPEGVLKSRPVGPGSLLLTNCATVGIPVFSGVSGCIHDGFLLFEGLDPRISDEYLFRLFEHLTPWFNAIAQTGTQANLNTGILKDLEVPLLPAEAQALLAMTLDALDSVAVIAERSLKAAAPLRAQLLAKMLGGLE